MAHINLLPWREQRRQQQKKQYLTGLALVGIITGLAFWLIGQVIDQQISNQNTRNQFIQHEIDALNSQIAEIKKIKDSKNAIEQRMALIEQLQSSRNISPRIFDELARIVPPGVSFYTMKRLGAKIEINGNSDSNNRLSEFMRRIEASEVFTGGELSSIIADTKAQDSASDFKLTFNISQRLLPLVSNDEKKGKK
jgi:type IV pilus assembly protein PilN